MRKNDPTSSHPPAYVQSALIDWVVWWDGQNTHIHQAETKVFCYTSPLANAVSLFLNTVLCYRCILCNVHMICFSSSLFLFYYANVNNNFHLFIIHYLKTHLIYLIFLNVYQTNNNSNNKNSCLSDMQQNTNHNNLIAMLFLF